MLLEFACSNHKSIRDEVLFSMLAGKDNAHEEKLYKVCGVGVLRAAVIYGANGSGKSNFIDAMSFVKNLVMFSINNQPGQGIRQTPHKLDGFDNESTYRMQFIAKGVRYAYGFSLKNMVVSEEYLYHFANNRQAKVFERTGETFSEGSRFRGKLARCKDVLRPNRMLLSCAANFSSVQEVSDVFAFFVDELIIRRQEGQDDWMKYSLYQMNGNPKMKAAVISFLSELGTGIKDVEVTVDQRKLESSELPSFLSDEFKSLLLKDGIDSIAAKVRYECFDTDLFQEESGGIRKLFALLCPFIDIMANGKTLICDELELGLHESLVFGLVRLFVNADTGQFAQLIFTTHETGLLNLDLFRRDQIWFTELRQEERATDVYSLAEIKNVRKEENFGKGYISGKYGAIPMLNLDFASIVSQM